MKSEKAMLNNMSMAIKGDIFTTFWRPPGDI